MLHIRTRLDRARHNKSVLEHKLNYLIQHGAKMSSIKTAHAKFYKAYLTFANIATRACEQGLL